MWKIAFLTPVILTLSLNASSADMFIGHAYYSKCPYVGCVDDKIYARPLFKKTQNGWQVFPNGDDIGNIPDDLRRSYKLFPSEIKWNIFNKNHSLIGKKTVKNDKPVSGGINAGAAEMQVDIGLINPDKKIFYDQSADLILSTNKNVVFSKFNTRETTDIEIYESAVKNIRSAENKADIIGSIEKSATIYSIENVDVIAILNFTQITEEIIDTDCVVLTKTGDKWEFVFDGRSFGYDDERKVWFELRIIADFDNDGKNEYIFDLSSGVNGFGYVLWHDVITKPLVYKFYIH